MLELCRGPITSDRLGAGWQALSGSLHPNAQVRPAQLVRCALRPRLLLSLLPGCGLQAPTDFRAAPSLLSLTPHFPRLTALGAFARPYIGLAGRGPVPDPSPLTSDL